MTDIIDLKSVHQYNQMVNAETLHPLVNVLDMSTFTPMHHFRANYGFYAIFLKEVNCGELLYGRNLYDYQEGTVVCVAPGQVLGVVNPKEVYQPKGWALVFHPDLIKGTSLGQNIRNYNFFSYEANEALHLSQKEREIIIDCMKKIQIELNHDIDKHTNKLISRNIELLLDYCARFYDRQFVTRENINNDILTRFEKLLDDYFSSEKPQNEGLPSVKYCAENLFLSANYFGDLIKKATGKSAQEYIQVKVIDIAKEKIFDSQKSISEVAYELGFKYHAHFTRLFKKCTGYSPSEYRTIS